MNFKKSDQMIKRGDEMNFLTYERILETQKFWEDKSQTDKTRLFAKAMAMDGRVEEANRVLSTNRQPPLMKTVKNLRQSVFIFLPYIGLTGAVKVLLDLGELLSCKGWEVAYGCHGEKSASTTVTIGDRKVLVQVYRHTDELAEWAKQYSSAIAPHWNMIVPLYSCFERVLFYAQGDYDTFSHETKIKQLLKLAYFIPVSIGSVSSYLANVYEQQYHRRPTILPCFLHEAFDEVQPATKRNQILVVGTQKAKEKRINETLHSAKKIARETNADVVWVTPTPPVIETEGITVIVNPKQVELREHYLSSKLFLSGSYVESLSLPPLEAMASSTPVVAVNNGGITEYGVHKDNCLLVAKDDWASLVDYGKSLLENEEKWKRLKEEGLITAARFQKKNMSANVVVAFEELMNRPFFE